MGPGALSVLAQRHDSPTGLQSTSSIYSLVASYHIVLILYFYILNICFIFMFIGIPIAKLSVILCVVVT